jgi:glycosyltransferase involved in cell wall biosynthesis
MSNLRLSIVLPTFNRRRRLERVLAGLDRQTVELSSFEAIVVDDGSTDDTAAWLASNSQRAYGLRHVRQQNAGPAKARNRGISAAQGELILFIDDDVEPTPELIAEHLRSHEEPDVVVLGPLASLEHYAQPWVAWEQAKLEAQYASMLRGDWAPTFRQFWTGNASVAKRHLDAVGGFDPSFLRAEDVELGRRLHERGLVFRFNPKARGWHHAERSLPAWEAMHRSYGSLEVKIFGGLGEDELLQTLAGNFSRIHPATRWLVTRCVGHERRLAAAAAALRSWLKLGAAAQKPVLAEQVCGALANLNYWQASYAELGVERTRRVFAMGDELRARARA